MSFIISFLARVYDKSTSKKRMHSYELFVVFLALTLFLGHLLLIFLARSEAVFLPLFEGSSFLSAIQTPFTVILYFEVFLLILSLAKPIAISVGKQFEIATLLVIRDVFKYLSEIEMRSTDINVLAMIGMSLVASVVVFVSLGLYYYVTRTKDLTSESDVHASFIRIKKVLAILVSLYLVTLILGEVFMVLLGLLTQNLFVLQQITFNHYRDVLTGMIFVDVIVFMLSLLYLTAYRHVFLESSLIISTILIRLSFSFVYPYNVFINVGAILFGLAIVYVYSYYSRYRLGSEDE